MMSTCGQPHGTPCHAIGYYIKQVWLQVGFAPTPCAGMASGSHTGGGFQHGWSDWHGQDDWYGQDVWHGQAWADQAWVQSWCVWPIWGGARAACLARVGRAEKVSRRARAYTLARPHRPLCPAPTPALAHPAPVIAEWANLAPARGSRSRARAPARGHPRRPTAQCSPPPPPAELRKSLPKPRL